ncbi:cytochrome P450 [Palleronia sp. KMU-117]|uniref:cytochrome P450 n=1 Tax=Palleronia sp. KMU-117 TaxID=3434108 RepID=UPI003D720E03
MIPPKPASRPRRVPFWRYVRLFRQDMLSSHPGHLYRARMAQFRAPFFRSVLINDPALIRTVLRDRPQDFPKSLRVAEGLRPLLGASVFLTNGPEWERQRRIIDPAFEGGRLRDSLGAIEAAARAAADRLRPGTVEIEAVTAHAAADVIFRTLFSVPIDDADAAEVFAAFRAYQRAQPLLNLGAFLRLPSWVPRGHGRAARDAAATIRRRVGAMTQARMDAIAAGTAPDDLATRIMTTPDPADGRTFGVDEMTDQVAIFFLAGHETSASALAWALYLLACDPGAQERVRDEARAALTAAGGAAGGAALPALGFTRDVLRETLRLYPPVPMMVRETTRPETFRGRVLGAGTQVVVSPWHLHRNDRHWPDPDAFRPDRWRDEGQRAAQRDAWLPFSAGRRVCPGAGFAMAEATLILAHLLTRFRFAPVTGRVPEPVAFLTVRGRDGIWLDVEEIAPGGGTGPGPAAARAHAP